MGNQIKITDKDGRHIATGDHGLGCCVYVSQVIQRHVPEFSMSCLKKGDEWLNKALTIAPPEDAVVIKLLLCDKVTLTSDDVPALEKAVANYPLSWKNEGPKRVLSIYLKLLKEHRGITTEYQSTYMAMTVTKAVGIH